MPNISLIYEKASSDWVSCNSILKNIISAYETMETDSECLVSHNQLDAETIFKNKISHLIFIDHRIVPNVVLNELLEKQGAANLPQLIIYIYGDFVINIMKWKGIEDMLKKFQVKFVCASHAQTGVLKKLLNNPNNLVTTIPFPIDSKFQFSESHSILAKEKFKIKSNDFIICYTGRISIQKNVIHLLSAFELLANLCPDVKLLIAGTFDDIGVPYLGLARLPLTTESEFYSKLDSFPKQVKDKILYLGNLNQDELIEVYCASNLYTSLSGHNDEDFGMSPAEALCCGLPLLLSSWGGFKDFKSNFPEIVETVELNLSPIGHKPEPNKVAAKLLKAISNFEKHNKKKSAQDSQKIYYTKAINLKYQTLIQMPLMPFVGFSPLFDRILIKLRLNTLFLDKKNIYDGDYDELYETYK